MADLEHLSRGCDVVVVSQLGHRHERIVNILICQRARLKVRLGVIIIYPVRLYSVRIDAGADIELVADDDEGYVRVVRRRLKRVFPLE